MSVRITGGVLANVVSDLTQSTADQVLRLPLPYQFVSHVLVRDIA